MTMQNRGMVDEKGFTMLELMVSLAILAVVLTGSYSVFVTQFQHNSREYKIAEGEMEFSIAKNIIERDIIMAGFGLADDYSSAPGGFAPRAIRAANGPPDTLTLMGTALGINSREAQTWTFSTSALAFRVWGDGREDVQAGDMVVAMAPNTKRLLTEGGATWLFKYQNAVSNFNPPLSALSQWTLVYGVDKNATVPYATVAYALGSAAATPTPASCANGSQSLLRTEYWTVNPVATDSIPVQTCVLDFQVSVGLDTDENESIDLWDEGGAITAGYDAASFKKRVKQVRLYILTQAGGRDANYTYPSNTIRVGDALLGTGSDFNLSAEQLKFRWKVIGITVTPRNIR